MATVKFEGGKALERALFEVTDAVAKRIGRTALRNAARPILAAYQAATVVDSGQLVQSEVIGTRARLNRRQKKLTPRPAREELEVHVGTADPAGIQQEFGNWRQRAQPALTSAWEAEGGEAALNRIGQEMGAAIERQAARARKG